MDDPFGLGLDTHSFNPSPKISPQPQCNGTGTFNKPFTNETKGDFIVSVDFVANREALWQAWLDVQVSSQEALQKGIGHYFTGIRQSVCDKLAIDALTHASLSKRDEGIYSHLVYLMDTYRQVVSLFENQSQPPSQSPSQSIEAQSIVTQSQFPAPNLVAGLCDVLNSRQRQFEDMQSQEAGMCKINPVALEKRGILVKALLHTTQQIEALESIYLEAIYLKANTHAKNTESHPREESAPSNNTITPTALLQAEPSAPWQALKDAICEENLPQLQALYQENLARCIVSINDLHARKTASYFADLLEREWEVLGIIIQVQVKAIEATCQAPDISTPILSKLREVYQQTGPVVEGFRKLLLSPKNPTEPQQGLTLESLASALTPPPHNIELNNQPFIEALIQEADTIFEGLRLTHLDEVHNLSTAIGDKLTLSKAIISAFEKAERQLAEIQVSAVEPSPAPKSETNPVATDNPVATITVDTQDSTGNSIATIITDNSNATDNPATATTDTLNTTDNPVAAITIDTPPPTTPPKPNPESEILAGIKETLSIKIESLKESHETFESAINQLQDGIKAPKLQLQDLESAAQQLKTAWYQNPPTEKPAGLDEAIANFFTHEHIITMDAFADYSNNFTKTISDTTAKADKAITRFKKETLLYEVSTFEEILFYSVTRLRASEAPHIQAAVSILDETFKEIEALISESGITVINPAPHEAFNGREHEVLTAEEQEGFKKGEIIKTMTSGYKQGTQVILRANVVAAR